MDTEKFRIEDNLISEIGSGMQLQAITFEEIGNDVPWISGWFRNNCGDLVIQKFIVLDKGKPTYISASLAVDFWGSQMLGISQADAIEMSSSFGDKLIIPAVKQNFVTSH